MPLRPALPKGSLPGTCNAAALPPCQLPCLSASPPLPTHFCSMFVGLALGCITNWLVGTPRHLRYHVIAASGEVNDANLLVAIAA